jgi:hypothetical protein
MSLTQTPAPARSDVATGANATASDRPGRTHPYRFHGTVLTAGAVAWSIAIALFGADPGDKTVPLVGFAIGSGFFQLGVMALLRVLWRSKALGPGRLARFFLRAEAVVLSLAIASTTVDALRLSDLTQPGWLMLDLCWPLSMLGMFAIGVRIAIAGRWQGVSRFWPMVAESWAVVTVPSLAIGGPSLARVVGALHLLVGYAVLGQIVARKRGDA